MEAYVQKSIPCEEINPHKFGIEQEARFEELENRHKECEHMPDKLKTIDMDYRGDKIYVLFQCECGEMVTEIFSFDYRKEGMI